MQETIESRSARVERELAILKATSTAGSPGWIAKVTGSFRDDPDFEEILKLGKEMQDAEEPENRPGELNNVFIRHRSSWVSAISELIRVSKSERASWATFARSVLYFHRFLSRAGQWLDGLCRCQQTNLPT